MVVTSIENVRYYALDTSNQITTIHGDLTVTGNLTIDGTTTTINSEFAISELDQLILDFSDEVKELQKQVKKLTAKVEKVEDEQKQQQQQVKKIEKEFEIVSENELKK